MSLISCNSLSHTSSRLDSVLCALGFRNGIWPLISLKLWFWLCSMLLLSVVMNLNWVPDAAFGATVRDRWEHPHTLSRLYHRVSVVIFLRCQRHVCCCDLRGAGRAASFSSSARSRSHCSSVRGSSTSKSLFGLPLRIRLSRSNSPLLSS